jgi:hypothetical protein
VSTDETVALQITAETLEAERYRKSIKRRIRNSGKPSESLSAIERAQALPRYHLAKSPDGKLERKKDRRGRMKLTWRQVGTLRELTKS